MVVSATGCLEVATTRYPTTAWNVPWLHVAFENAAAAASGVESAYRALRRRGGLPQEDELTIVAFAGDTHQAAHALYGVVVARPFAIGSSLAEAGHAAIDQRRERAADVLIAPHGGLACGSLGWHAERRWRGLRQCEWSGWCG